MRYLLITALFANTSYIAHAQDEVEDEQAHKVLPALKVLPAGSVLKDVRIPRYTAELLPASFLKAKKLTIVNKTEVEGEGVDITVFDDAGKPKLSSHISKLLYNKSAGTIVSQQQLIFKGDTFHIKSQGLVTNWDDQQGFLLGKTETIIYLKKPLFMKPSTKKSPVKKSAAAAIAAVAITYPNNLTAQNMAELDKISAPSTVLIQENSANHKAEMASYDELSKALTAQKAAVALKLLTSLPVAVAQPEQKEAKAEDGLNLLKAIKITSKGNPFFDAKKGVLIYEKNFNAVSERFTFTADGEVKFLAEEQAFVKKLSDEAKKKLKFEERYHTRVIANKNIKIRTKDKDGKPIKIDAGNLIYDHNAKTIIIRGLGSSMTTKGLKIKIVKPDGYIRFKIDKDNEFENMTFPGTEQFLDLDKLKDDDKKKKQP